MKIGDRVVAIKEHDGNDHIVGKTGTIVGIAQSIHDIFAVKFDEDVDGWASDENGNFSGRGIGNTWNIPKNKLEYDKQEIFNRLVDEYYENN